VTGELRVTDTDRTFDWRSEHDARSLSYPIREAIGFVKRKPRMWRTGYVRLDQGREGACVGFGWTGELLGWPVPAKLTDADAYARSIYRDAQRVDQWPGENYSGTSVLAGAKVVQARGWMGSYRWAFGIDDAIDAIIAEGPVVVGIPWKDSMYRTRPSGLVDISGSVVGGHCVVLTGYTRATLHAERGYGVLDLVRFRNSWGPDYGLNGSGWFRAADLEALLADDGEACVPQERKVP
jgi:hypothetical protein